MKFSMLVFEILGFSFIPINWGSLFSIRRLENVSYNLQTDIHVLRTDAAI